AADAVRSERGKILSAVMVCHRRGAVLDPRPGREEPNQQLPIFIAVCCERLVEAANPEKQFTSKGNIAAVKVSQSESVVGTGKCFVLLSPHAGEIMGDRRRGGIEGDRDGAQNNTLVRALMGIQMGVKQFGNRFHIIVQQNEQLAAGDSNASIARSRS